ncbi:MAG: putative aluminum resistance protein, partial [Firmicutes bacterium]|nr:putative aluminum resistance protein [Bacillota bacterium]
MDALNLIRLAEKDMQELFSYYEEIAYDNQAKVLKAFRDHRVRVRPGDELLSLVGSPYDTLLNVIGTKNPHRGSLIERGIKYREIALLPSGEVDLEAIHKGVTDKTRLVLIQRSRGYSLRPALTIEKIKQVVEIVRQVNPDTIIFVDNCYGEFTDRLEPTQLGVDLMAGSLIKNPGGGLVPSGGYILGRSDLVEEVAYHITAPGLGKELGASLISNRLLYQGLFMAPHTVLQALKTACLLAYVCEYFGCNVLPRWNET